MYVNISITDESVRWLFANGRDEEAHKIIKKVARINKKNYSDVILRAENKVIELEALAKAKGRQGNSTLKNEPEVISSSDVRRYTALTILKDRRILINSIITWFVW